MPSILRNALALSAAAAVAVAQADQAGTPKVDAPCADVVIFMARGNHAPYHDSRTFPFVDATCGKLKAEGKTCDFIEITFPYGGDYCPQIGDGVRNGLSQMTAFNKKCPCTHLILNGYSQGAWIAGDILAGPGGCSQITTGLDNASGPGHAIAAALLWGDVMHEANQPYNVLDGSDLQKSGRSAESLARLNSRYSNVLRSYCSKGDPICANGDDVSKHLSYFEKYTEDASTWAVGKINQAAPLCAAPKASPSASSTVVASSVVVAEATSVASASASSSVDASSAGLAVSVGVAKASSVAVADSMSIGVALSMSVGIAEPTAVASMGASSPVDVASVGAAAATAVASSGAAAPTSPALPAYPTSPVHVAPFPIPQPYEDTCIPSVDIKYVYA